MKRETIYNKLVRDNILDVISKNNQDYTYHVASNEEYKQKLIEKLQEEVQEFIIGKNEEELGDILEVIDYIITVFEFNKEKILEMKEIKNKKRGGFKKKIILESVFDF